MGLRNAPIGRRGLTIAVLVLVAVGIGAWQLWPEPAIGVPGRVCQEAIPGRYAAEVLPERGEHFQEGAVYAYTTTGDLYARNSGNCMLSGGGKDLGINFFRVPTSDYGSADLAKDRERAGNTPVTLGPAQGFAHGWVVDLFTDCSARNGKAYLKIQVDTNRSGTPDEEALKNLADLAGGTMRAVANKRIGCEEGTPKLPDGPPKLG